MFRVKWNWLGVGGVEGVSVLHFENLGTDSIGEQAQGCVERSDQFWFAVKDYFANTTSFQVDPEVFSVDKETGEVLSAFICEPADRTPGTNLTQAVPQAAQVLVRQVTGARRFGRKVIGHTYLPGFAMNGMSGGEVGNAAQAEIVSGFELLLSPPGNALQVWSRPDLIRARIGATTPVSQVQVWNEFATLRKRRS